MREIEVRSSGREVVASRGDRIVVTLPENAATGFRWVVGELPAAIELEDDRFVPPGSTRPGAGGEHRITLVARASGEARVQLTLERPWEGEAADRFELLVTVR